METIKNLLNMSMVMSVYNFVKPTRATQLGRQSTAMRPVRKSTWGDMFRSCYFIKTCTLMFYIFTVGAAGEYLSKTLTNKLIIGFIRLRFFVFYLKINNLLTKMI